MSTFAAVETPRVHAGLLRASGTRRVGVLNPCYGLEKVSYALPVRGIDYVTVKAVPFHRLLDRRGTFWSYTPVILDRSSHLIHTFNSLPANSRRFVVSYEMELPRYLGQVSPGQLAHGFRILASDRCRAILALSEAARAFFQARLERAGRGELREKLSVFRGGISCLPGVKAFEREGDDRGPLRVILVGADARRKGLVPLLTAIEELRRGGLEIELTVVSSISDHSYALPDDLFPAQSLRSRLQELSWVTHHLFLENARVRELVNQSDLFALPTLDESLGWSLIEAGMEGVPLVSTNVFAVPEILRGGLDGWVVPLDLNEDLRWCGIYLDGQARRDAVVASFERMARSLVAILGEAHGNRALLRQRGRSCFDHVSSHYDVMRAGAALDEIYARALG